MNCDRDINAAKNILMNGLMNIRIFIPSMLIGG